MDPMTIKMLLMPIGGFLLGFVFGYQYAMSETGAGE